MSDEPPIACTLETDAIPARVGDWQSVLDGAGARTTAADGTLRVEFGDDTDLGELARLVVAEQHCCAFLSFAITVDQRGLGLEVRAPEEAGEVLATLFGG